MSLKPKPISIEQRIKDLINSAPSQADIQQQKEDKKNNIQPQVNKIDRPSRPLPKYTITSVSAAGTNINK